MKLIAEIPDRTPTIHYEFSPDVIKSMIGKPVKDQDGNIVGKIKDAYDIPTGVRLLMDIRDEERYQRIYNHIAGYTAETCPHCSRRLDIK